MKVSVESVRQTFGNNTTPIQDEVQVKFIMKRTVHVADTVWAHPATTAEFDTFGDRMRCLSDTFRCQINAKPDVKKAVLLQRAALSSPTDTDRRARDMPTDEVLGHYV